MIVPTISAASPPPRAIPRNLRRKYRTPVDILRSPWFSLGFHSRLINDEWTNDYFNWSSQQQEDFERGRALAIFAPFVNLRDQREKVTYEALLAFADGIRIGAII